MPETAEKTATIAQYQRDGNDTGSPEVQVALLTKRIQHLTRHLQAFPKDAHSRRGLYGLVSRRKRLLSYLSRVKPEAHTKLLQELGIRG